MFDHPVNVSRLAQVRYDEMLQQAAHYRQVQKLKAEGPPRLAQLLARFSKQQPAVQVKAHDIVAPV